MGLSKLCHMTEPELLRMRLPVSRSSAIESFDEKEATLDDQRVFERLSTMARFPSVVIVREPDLPRTGELRLATQRTVEVEKLWYQMPT